MTSIIYFLHILIHGLQKKAYRSESVVAGYHGRSGFLHPAVIKIFTAMSQCHDKRRHSIPGAVTKALRFFPTVAYEDLTKQHIAWMFKRIFILSYQIIVTCYFFTVILTFFITLLPFFLFLNKFAFDHYTSFPEKNVMLSSLLTDFTKKVHHSNLYLTHFKNFNRVFLQIYQHHPSFLSETPSDGQQVSGLQVQDEAHPPATLSRSSSDTELLFKFSR